VIRLAGREQENARSNVLSLEDMKVFPIPSGQGKGGKGT